MERVVPVMQIIAGSTAVSSEHAWEGMPSHHEPKPIQAQKQARRTWTGAVYLACTHEQLGVTMHAVGTGSVYYQSQEAPSPSAESATLLCLPLP